MMHPISSLGTAISWDCWGAPDWFPPPPDRSWLPASAARAANQRRVWNIQKQLFTAVWFAISSKGRNKECPICMLMKRTEMTYLKRSSNRRHLRQSIRRDQGPPSWPMGCRTICSSVEINCGRSNKEAKRIQKKKKKKKETDEKKKKQEGNSQGK